MLFSCCSWEQLVCAALESCRSSGWSCQSGTFAEWSDVAWLVASLSVGFMFLGLFLQFVGLKNNPRPSLVYLRNGILPSLLFSVIHSFSGRLLHGTLPLITAVVVLGIFASATVNRRSSRTEKTP